MAVMADISTIDAIPPITAPPIRAGCVSLLDVCVVVIRTNNS